jgi:hypothetical protein
VGCAIALQKVGVLYWKNDFINGYCLGFEVQLNELGIMLA